jgi:U32 family peptidase
MGEAKPLGVVSNYFDHVCVAAIKLESSLKVGAKIRFVGGENTDFEQKVDSMQIHHDKVGKAKKGDEVGLIVKERVRKGYRVFKA